MRAACLALVATLLAAPLAAQERTPAEAEKLYREVGEQLNCICGDCRDRLLECSHNTCKVKEAMRSYLRELTQDGRNDTAAIRQQMAARFGERALQVPAESNIYAVLAIGLAALTGAFGCMFWYVARRKGVSEDSPKSLDEATDVQRTETEVRIERDMQELQ